MSMKKTDLEKHLAKKIDGGLKSSAVSQRFGQGSAVVKEKTEMRVHTQPAKLVAVSCRLPADLVNRLREAAKAREGGMNALLTRAAEQWLASAGSQKQP